jgi:cytochrome c556
MRDLINVLEEALEGGQYEEQRSALLRYVWRKESELAETAAEIRRMHTRMRREGQPVDAAAFEAQLEQLQLLLNQLRNRFRHPPG